MSRSERRPRSFRAGPEPGAASGGHLTPEVDTTGSLLDPLLDPLPPSTDRTPRPVRDGLATDLDPAAGPLPDEDDFFGPPKRRPSRKPVRKVRPAVRRVKRTLKRVDPLTVLKLSLFYYTFFLIIWLGIVAVIYWTVQSMGVFDAIEKFSEGFALEWGKIDISLAFVERWALIIGLILVLIGAIVNAFLAFLYNLAADVVGGLELTFVERDLVDRQ